MADFQPFDYGQVVDAANRNALAQAQLSTIRQQNEMAQQKFSLEQQQQNTDWLRAATDQVMQNPDLLPAMLDVGRQKGIINPSFDTSTITMDQVRQLNQRLNMGVQPQQDTVQSAQILANGNIGYLSKSGKVVDTGQKASETYAIRDVAGAVMPISTRTGRAGQPLATAAQTQEAEAGKQAAITSAKGKVEAQASLPDQLAETDLYIGNIDNFISSPGFSSVYGSSRYTTPGRLLPGSDWYNAEAMRKQLDAQAFGISIQKMKGLGGLSEAEGKKVSAAFTRATEPNISPKEAQKAWGEVKTYLELGKQRLIQKSGVQQPSMQQGGQRPPLNTFQR